jgi:hypothetical protein
MPVPVCELCGYQTEVDTVLISAAIRRILRPPDIQAAAHQTHSSSQTTNPLTATNSISHLIPTQLTQLFYLSFSVHDSGEDGQYCPTKKIFPQKNSPIVRLHEVILRIPLCSTRLDRHEMNTIGNNSLFECKFVLCTILSTSLLQNKPHRLLQFIG